MKKLYVLALLMMLSIAAMAQSIVVVDKNGKRTAFDPAQIVSVDFQTNPPGFVIHQTDGNFITFIYDVVQSILGSPNYVFAHPESVEAAADGETIDFQVNANVEYDATPSAAWITITNADAGQHTVTAAMNPSVDERTGYVLLATKDGLLTDTIFVNQAGKDDSRYINIDWEENTLDSYDSETGIAVITFKDEVPVMGEYDVVMLPDEVGNLIIRVIEEVTEVAGKTATLKTTQGDMGNLFRDQEFAFEFGGDGTASARGTSDSKPVFRPEKVEVFENGKYVEVYNANARARRALDNGDLTISYEGSDKELWSLSDRGSIILKRGALQVSMKGTIEYAFKKEPWYKVWKSSATKANVILEGNWDSDILYRVVTNTAAEINYDNSTSYDDDDVLKANALKRRYTFKVGEIPVQVVVDGDVKCSYDANLMGVGNITSGLKVGKHFKYGIKVNTQTEPEFVSEDVIDRSRTSLSYPQVFIGNPDYLNSNCIGGLTVYPEITIGFYGIGSRTIFHPVEKLYLRAQSWEANHATNPGEKAERVRVSRLTDVHILMRDIPSSLLELSYLYGKHFSNLDEEGHAETLVEYPEYARITPDDTNLMEGDEQELEVTAFHHNNVTGEELPTEGAWVEFDVVGSGNNKIWKKTDENGKIKLKFTKGSTLEEKVKYRLYTKRGEYKEGVWTSKLLAYNIKCETPSQEVEKGAENVPVTFLLQKAVAGTVTPWANKRVEFIATNGTVSPRYNTTDANGNVKAFFTPTNDAPEGEVIAIVTEEGNTKDWEGRATGKITIKSDGGGGDVFDKAKKLNDNVYIVRDKDGNESTRGLLQDWSQWNRGKAGCDGQTRVIKISLEDGKVDQESGSVDTQGGGYFEIPIDHFGEPMQLLLDYIATYGTLQGSFFTFKKPDEGYSSSNYLSLKFGCGDMHNLKSGTVQLQKKGSSANAPAKASRRALEEDYSGELELVFAFTFTNLIYDNETGQETEDAEYTVYGKAVVNEFSPKITYYKLEPESGFVGVGKSVAVNVKEYYDEDAVWNWDDVELVASYVNYANYETDEGYFSWDPATHSLTSLKTNNNESVYVRFRLKSNPELTSYFTIRTGDGWPYTAFTISPAEQTVEHGYNCQFNIESWAPADIAWDPYAIEIDPDTNPGSYHKYFIYEPGFPRFRCSYAAEAGTYNVRMRLMSDHSVGFTMKIIVTAEH